MPIRHPSSATLVLLFVALFFVLTDGKGFGGSRGSGGFKGGSKGAGSFGGSSSYNRPSAYGPSMVKPSGGGGFRKAATSFAAGAAGGVAAYGIMRAMSGSGGYRSGHYAPGYGGGETCTNNEDINGTVFGTFRCPLNGFTYEDKYCCGERGFQYCCSRRERSRFSQGASYVIWITLILVALLLIGIFWARHQRRKQKEVIMVPTEIPAGETQGPPYYHPAPPPMGYPPPPQGNPYGPPPQGYPTNYNPYQPPPQPHYNPYQTGPGY